METEQTELERLRKQVQELEQEKNELKARVQALESQLKILGHEPSPPAAVH